MSSERSPPGGGGRGGDTENWSEQVVWNCLVTRKTSMSRVLLLASTCSHQMIRCSKKFTVACKRTFVRVKIFDKSLLDKRCLPFPMRPGKLCSGIGGGGGSTSTRQQVQRSGYSVSSVDMFAPTNKEPKPKRNSAREGPKDSISRGNSSVQTGTKDTRIVHCFWWHS